MTTTIPASPSKEELSSETAPILATASALEIDSTFMYEQAGEELKTIKGKAKALEEKRKAITGPLDKAKKEVMDLFRAPLADLEKAEGIIKRAMLQYQRDEQAKADKKCREAERLAEASRKQIAEQAKEAEQSGDVVTAMTLQATAEMVTAQPVVAEPAKVAGISTTTRWVAEVEDKLAYIKHVAENPDLLDTLEVNMKPLNQMATALKDKLRLPGIKAVGKESISARS